jgi:short-subunit dehydrogenase
MTAPYSAAVVTGASSGIGRAVAVELARRGVPVGAVARRADRLADLRRTAAGRIETEVADVTDRPALAAAVRRLADRLGPIDLLVANAGVAGGEVEAVMRVNFLGVVHAIDAVLPTMLARGRGHLVGVSSLAAYKGLPGSAAYSASKAAVNAYLEGLRIELRPRGVAVTCVCPGFVRTEMTADKTHPMPFLMDADRAARRIVSALRRRPAVYDFPKRMRAVMWLAKWAPDRLIARMANPERE